MTQHVTERLSEYLDAELEVAERTAVEQHLGECAECARVLEELRAVVVEAGRLTDPPAPSDLWPEVAGRLRPRRPSVVSLAGRIPRRFQITLPQLAAAGLLLVLVSSGSVWLALRRPPAGTAPGAIATRIPTTAPTGTAAEEPAPEAAPPATTPFRRMPGAVTPPTADASFASFDEASYDAAVAELERALREHGAELDTSTVRILQQNLAIIDRAIAQARQALLADPANPYLNGHLAEQMKLKVRLLQRATEVVAAHG